jgi:hypothetical protein
MQTAINIINTSSTVVRNPRLNVYDYGSGGGGNVQFNTARGTSAAPTAILLGDALGKVEFGGHNGATFPDGAQIRAHASENWTGSTFGTSIVFNTVLTGANNIAERMRIDGNGFVGIGTGTVTPEAALHVANTTTTTPRGIISQQASSDGSSAFLIFRKGRGTITAPLAVQNGDNLGALYSEGYDGTAFLRSGAFIKFSTSGAIAAGSIPTDICFNTGSSGLGTERMRITSAGYIQIALTSCPIYANNAAAIAGGLPVGALYRSGGDPDQLYIVH